MKKKLFAALGLLGIFAVATGATHGWLRQGDVTIHGIIYAGSADTALTNSSGQLLSSAMSNSTFVNLTTAQSKAGALTLTDPPLFASAETGLTAHAGGTQAAALVLTATKFAHDVSTVGSASDSVVLPTPVLGTAHIVSNSAASNALQLFAVSPATINGAATATGVALSAKKSTFCVATSTSNYACTGPN